LQSAMTSVADQAGWNALRAMQERSLLLHQLADLERGAGHDDEAKRLEAAATHIERQVGVLQRVLEDGPDPVE